MKKAKLSLILTVLALCMALSACSEKKTESTEKSNDSELSSADGTKVSLVAGMLEHNGMEETTHVNFELEKGNSEEIRKQVEYKEISSLNTMLLELSAGRLDYLQLPNSVGSYLTASDDKLVIKTEESDLPHQHYHMAARTDDAELCDEMSKAIDTLKADGTLDQLAADYIIGTAGTPTANTLLKHEGAETHVVAVTGDLPPMDYVSSDGAPSGFNVALLNAISEISGCNFEIVQLEAAARLSALESGKVDLIFWIGCYSSKGFEPESDNVYLSTPYFEESSCLVGYSEDTLEKALSIYQNQNSSATDPSVTPSSAPSAASATIAPSTPTLDLEMAAKVNTMSNLLENYKTVTYSQLDYVSGDNIYVTCFKDDDGNNCSTEDDNGYTNYQTDYFHFSRSKGKSAYAISAMGYGLVSDLLYMVADSKITSQTTDVNGNLVCEAQGDINQEYADQLSENWPATTQDKMITTTVFAADDFRALSTDFSIRRPDGSESKIASGVMVYDKEVSYSEAVQNYLDAEKAIVSIQMPDGSIRTMKIPMGESFEWYCDEGFALYLDKEGKTPLSEQPDPVEGDLTLYCLAKN